MFKYTKAAIDIVIEDIKRYCNIFKYGSFIFTFIYLGYAIYSKSGIFAVNIILLSALLFYFIFDVITHNKDLKQLKKIVRRVYKVIKYSMKTFTLGVMVYSIYAASTNVSAISIILATLMIIMWFLQLLLEFVVEIFDDKKDLIIAGWSKDIDNLKRPVTTVNNFIKKVKGEDIIDDEPTSKEIKILEKKISKDKKVKV